MNTSKVSKSSQKIILAAMILAVSMTTIDQTIVALASGAIQSGLGISQALVAWSINAYILATAAFFLIGGKLADVFGHKRMAIIGIVLFALCSLAASLTPSGNYAGVWMITSRALQGLGTALMFPAALGIVRSSFPSDGQGRAAANFFGITGAMTALGPILGSYLITWDWRAIFWINLPIAVLSLVLLMSVKTVMDKPQPTAIDWQAGGISALGMTSIVLGLQQANSWGWTSLLTWLCVIGGLTLLVIYILREKSAASPLIDISLFKNRGFSISAVAILTASMAFMPIFFFISVYAEVSLGLSVGASGLILLEFFIGYVIGARFGGKLFDNKGARLPLIFGGLIGAVGFAWWTARLGILTQGGDFLQSPQFWPTLLAGLGIGMMFGTASTDLATRSTSKAYGAASGISQTAKNLGGAIGLALFSAVLSTTLLTNLTNSFVHIGAPATIAAQVADEISNGTRSASTNKQLSSAPQSVQEQFENAVRTSYADAMKPVFYGMASAMAIVFVLGLIYPLEESTAVSSSGGK